MTGASIKGQWCTKHRRLQARPRGATPRPRTGAEARRTPCPKGSGQEELPHVRGQGQLPRVPDCDGTGTAERSYPASEITGEWLRGVTPHPRSGAATRGVTPRPRSGVAAGRSYPTPQARGQGRWPGGPTPSPRSRGCAGTGGPRGAILR